MKRYRGFVGEVSPLGGLGITRRSLYNGYGDILERRRLLTTTEPIRASDIYTTQPIKPPTEAAPVLEPSPMVQPAVEPERYIIDMDFGDPSTWINGAGPVMVSPGDQELEARQYKEGGDGRAETLETQAEIDKAIQRATGGSGPTETIMPVGTKPEMPALLPLAIGAALIYFMR